MEQPLVVDKWLFTGVIAVLILKAPSERGLREAVEEPAIMKIRT